MQHPHYRYFIELQHAGGGQVPRAVEAETRREAALECLISIRDWLKQHDLDEKVSGLSVTAFGQIQITCDISVIRLIRSEETIDIAAIRQGMMFAEMSSRWNEAH